SGHVSLRLLDGTVLLASKKDVKMELYEPSKRSFRLLDAQAYDGRSAVLGNGRVIFLADDGTCALYDPQAATWMRCAPMPTKREAFSMTVVDEGLLVIGGFSDRKSSTAVAVTQLYDPDHDVWSVLPDMPIPRAEHVALRLSDGRVLIAGGTGKSPIKRA